MLLHTLLKQSHTHYWNILTHTTETLSHTLLKRCHTHYWNALTHTTETLSYTLLKCCHTHYWNAVTHITETLLHTLLKYSHTHYWNALTHITETLSHTLITTKKFYHILGKCAHTAEMLWYRIVNYDSSVVNMKITSNRKAFLSSDGNRKTPHREMQVLLLSLMYFNPYFNHNVCPSDILLFIYIRRISENKETKNGRETRLLQGNT